MTSVELEQYTLDKLRLAVWKAAMAWRFWSTVVTATMAQVEATTGRETTQWRIKCVKMTNRNERAEPARVALRIETTYQPAPA